MAERAAAGVQAAHARVLAEHELRAGRAHRFRPHDLVGEGVLQHAVLMDARLRGQRRWPRRWPCSARRRCPRSTPGPGWSAPGGRDDPGVVRQRLAPHVERHDDFLERGVAGPFADAVDRAFHLPRPGLNGRERVGDREAKVVVAVRRQRDGVADTGPDPREHVRDVSRQRVADRVGQIDRRGAGLDRGCRHRHKGTPGCCGWRPPPRTPRPASARGRTGRPAASGRGRSGNRFAACARDGGPRSPGTRESAA